MLDSDFKNVITLRQQRVGSRKNASDVEWDPVLDDSNEPVRIPCRFKRSGTKDFTLREVQDQADASMLFQVTSTQDVTRENLVVDERGNAYKVLRFTEDEDLDLSTVYKRLELKKVKETFPPAGGDE